MPFDPASQYWAILPGRRAVALIPSDPYEGAWFVAMIHADTEARDSVSPPLRESEIPYWISRHAEKWGCDPAALRFEPREPDPVIWNWIRDAWEAAGPYLN